MFSASASLAISSSIIVYTSAQATLGVSASGVSVSGCSPLTHRGATGGEHCNVGQD